MKTLPCLRSSINHHQAFGYHLRHRLAALGVTNYVVQPQDWDESGKGVKNDRIDAQALCQRLDRYVRGNRKAFSC